MQTIFETPNLSNAAAMVEFCATELYRAGFTKEAESIRGMEVFSMLSARNALGELRKLTVDDEEVNSAIRYTVAMLASLTDTRELRQAS